MANVAPKSFVELPPRLSITPPRETEKTPPPLANQVRVIQSSDALTIHAYFLSPTLMDAVARGEPDTGIRIEGDIAFIEANPAARFALPLTVAVTLAELLISNLVSIGPGVSPFVDQFLKRLQGSEDGART
jgi:hypothetical protein